MEGVDATLLLRRTYRLFDVNASSDHNVGKGQGLYKSKHKVTWRTFQRRKVDYDTIYSRQTIGLRDPMLDPTTAYECVHFHTLHKEVSKKCKLEVYSASCRHQFDEGKPAACVFRLEVKQICEDSRL